MSIDAMKQALEALEETNKEGVPFFHSSVIDNLRAAIEAAERQEPMTYFYRYEDGVTPHLRSYAPLEAIPLYTTPQPAIPDGWQLVPVEPTPEMIETYLDSNAAYWVENDKLPSPIGKWRSGTAKEATKAGYKAMLAAAKEQK